jgi:predicted enzyme related to lactoylglutathione lyase
MHIQSAQLWVHDQNEALGFYVGKLGWEVRSDVTMAELGGFRWLTVGPLGQDDFSVVLMAIPGPPIMDSETAEQVRTLMAKGFAGTVFLTTDDVDGDYTRLSLAGVEFTSAPTDMPYGRDCGLRDPSGNQLRLAQLSPEFAVA